jgi:PAS domain S-box-containing protein
VTASRWRISLKAILIALVASALLPVMIFLFAELSQANRARSATLEGDGRQFAEKAELIVERVVAERLAIMKVLGGSPALRSGDFASFYQQARASLDPVEGAINVFDRSRNMLASTAVPFGAPLPATAEDGAIDRAFATGEPQTSDLFTSPFTGKPVLSVVYKPPEADYALRATLRSEWLGKELARSATPGWIFVVADKEGKIAARTRDPERWVGSNVTPVAQANFQAAPTGWAQTVSLEGTPYYTAWRRSPFGWTVAAGVDQTDLELAVRGETQRVSIGAAIATLCGLVFAALAGAAIGRPLARLAHAAERFGKGASFEKPDTVIREIDAVEATLFDAINARRSAEEALRASEARTKAVVETAIDAIVVADERGVIQSANPATERLFGFASEELIGQNVSKLMPEQHGSAHDGYIRAFRQTGRAKIIGTGRELVGRRKDGSLFAVELALAEWRLDGKTFFTGIMRDISERKAREEQIRGLLREVNHRSKNLLTVVQAIARQTSTTPGDFAQKFNGRLRALASNQDLLVSTEWRGVEMGDLIRIQVAPFCDLVESQVEIDGAPVHLKPAAAQAIGMAIHELATNASKYGALSNDIGRVLVRWRIDGDDFLLDWVEVDGPTVAPSQARGFGSTVVETMVIRSVGGRVEFDFPATGVTWRLRCPKAKVIDQPEQETIATTGVEGRPGSASGGGEPAPQSSRTT